MLINNYISYILTIYSYNIFFTNTNSNLIKHINIKNALYSKAFNNRIKI